VDLKLTPELQNKLINGGILFLALFFSFKMYQGQRQVVTQLMAQKEVELNKSMTITSIDSLNKKITAYKQLVNTKDVNSLFNTINTLVSECGVKISSLKPLPENSTPLSTEYAFQITATAPSFHAIGKLISKLENHHDIFIVTSVGITSSRAGSGNDSDLVSVDLRLTSFVIK